MQLVKEKETTFKESEKEMSGAELLEASLSHNDNAREGSELDAPGKERQERARVRMDSESLDEEDS
ncbi:hypothetical protein VULLAG_LOCUS22857 [Vulpes lagopus]